MRQISRRVFSAATRAVEGDSLTVNTLETRMYDGDQVLIGQSKLSDEMLRTIIYCQLNPEMWCISGGAYL